MNWNQIASYIAVGLVSCIFSLYISLLPPHKRGWLAGKCYTMPPGPVGSSITGSLLEWLEARQGGNTVSWLKEQARYGEMATFSMGTKTWVILNSNRVLNEIIAKRAAITHERPYFPVASGLVSRNKRVFLLKTEDWREGRRYLHKLLMGVGSKEHKEVVESASIGLLEAYLEDPEAWYAHNYRFTVEIMNQLITCTPLNKTRKQLEDLQYVTSTFLTSINSSFVEFFPALTALPKPLQYWRRHWEDMGAFHYDTFKKWWTDMITDLTPEHTKPSFVREVVLKEYSGRNDEGMYLTMLGMAAGADNPRMTLNAWVMACLAYPDVMRKGRAQVDSICGSNAERLPGLDDLSRLPYICAMVKEVLRWRPTVPIIPQRVLVEDMHFEGYTFPAGTEFLVNTIAVCERDYNQPEKFIPERWIDSTTGAGIEQDLWHYAFSAGRRSCLGYKLAQKELFVSFARLLYCFDFTARDDYSDESLNPFSLGEPFPVTVHVRGERFEKLIRKEAAKQPRLNK